MKGVYMKGMALLLTVLSTASAHAEVVMRCRVSGPSMDSDAWQYASEIQDCIFGYCHPTGEIGFRWFLTRQWKGSNNGHVDYLTWVNVPNVRIESLNEKAIVTFLAADPFFDLSRNDPKGTPLLNNENDQLSKQRIEAPLADFKPGITKTLRVGVLTADSNAEDPSFNWKVKYEDAMISCKYEP